MRKMSRICAFLLALMLVAAFPVTVSANSAEPPGLLIIASNAPEDAVIKLEDGSAKESRRLWESYFRIYYHELGDYEGLILTVESAEKTFSCQVPAGSYDAYNNLLTLDFEAQTLTQGDSPWRVGILVALRVCLTLLIEAAVFWLFGFRSRRTWGLFVLVNLITQTALNIVVTGPIVYGGYWVILYGFAEFLIFAVEGIVLSQTVKEKGEGLTAGCSILANGASLLLGGWLLTWLPV